MQKFLSYSCLIVFSFIVLTQNGYGQMMFSVQNQYNVQMLPPTIIFKMNKKYINCVPISVSEDKTTILSYPDPRDISEHSRPTPLKKGYYLDNRGIGANTVLLNITYDEYAKLPTAPNIDQLKKMIIKGNPIKKIYLCKKAILSENCTENLCKIIDNKFIDCERIK